MCDNCGSDRRYGACDDVLLIVGPEPGNECLECGWRRAPRRARSGGGEDDSREGRREVSQGPARAHIDSTANEPDL
ncbi:hypothetical protein NDU88_004044 [Pleurodeles waltl]|uniref:Uncharacterized protein n=1 Tax=Pleurodeles waltl TaxID=8319 RepID=A0AAV7LGZ0_PLEWA|nr:hypothetical protein NDU88_004044 [Pleurodeles waltl]